ncbi:HNH endonuclease [Shewanella sp. YIC-542]|uniref:HNH endonuclease n=1 Tax=Shewanella mytili TaxID=3377111 RepID=UPI00398EA4B5
MFKIGTIYKRKEEIHHIYGGQSQGGISTPSGWPMVLVFTSNTAESYGYQDQFRPDGLFWYTGEGQVGPMTMTRGNAAIRDHLKYGKKLHLFKYIKSAHVRYIGEAQYVGHHIEQRLDREGNMRDAIIFHLALLPTQFFEIREPINQYGDAKMPGKHLSLSELRMLALGSVTDNLSIKQIIHNVAIRSAAIRRYALKRAQGVCEGCLAPAPFQGKAGPFLEVHHLLMLGDGGPDHPQNVIALCPNCHRRAHLSKDAESYNQELIEKVIKLENGSFHAHLH